MPLDGLRAWIGEVERKLGMRTRVFLVLATIAIGGAGAAIYLALDTRDNAVSESDVQELQEQLEARAATSGAAGGADTAQLEAELKALEAEVERLGGNGGSEQGGSGGGGSNKGTGGSNEADEGADTAGGASTGGDAGTKSKLRELLEQTKEQNEKLEEAE